MSYWRGPSNVFEYLRWLWRGRPSLRRWVFSRRYKRWD